MVMPRRGLFVNVSSKLMYLTERRTSENIYIEKILMQSQQMWMSADSMDGDSGLGT